MRRTDILIVLALAALVLTVQFVVRRRLETVEAPRPVEAIPEQTALAAVSVPEPTGEPVQIFERNRVSTAIAVAERPGEVLVHYPGQPRDMDVWLSVEQVRFPSRDEDVRDRHWTGQASVRGLWRPCEVLKRNGTRYLVHYTGESAYYDEWLPASRLRLP